MADYHTVPEEDTTGAIPYIPYTQNQTEITNLNYVEWGNVLNKPTFGIGSKRIGKTCW
jgi:hypothetical protein